MIVISWLFVLQVDEDDDELSREDEEETSKGQFDSAAVFLLRGGERKLQLQQTSSLTQNCTCKYVL